MTAKNALHELIDELPAKEVATARRFLEYLRDVGGAGLPRFLAEAPEDDEPETPEEAAAIAQARKDVKARRVVSHRTIRGECGD